jgi:phage-related protein
MNKYEIIYYSDKIQADIMNLPITLQSKYAHYTKLIMEYGTNLGMPHTKAMGSGLFELRLKGAEGIARVFYCTVIDRKVVMLHSFVKKTDKTPKQDLNLAIKRMNEVKAK